MTIDSPGAAPVPDMVFRGFHPVSEVFPPMDETALADLVNDIKTHGLREPITLDPHGLLLDGRNRLAACEKAGVTPRFRIFDGHPLTFVVSENLQRRHLDTGARWSPPGSPT